jgi:hypothetical protein
MRFIRDPPWIFMQLIVKCKYARVKQMLSILPAAISADRLHAAIRSQWLLTPGQREARHILHRALLPFVWQLLNRLSTQPPPDPSHAGLHSAASPCPMPSAKPILADQFEGRRQQKHNEAFTFRPGQNDATFQAFHRISLSCHARPPAPLSPPRGSPSGCCFPLSTFLHSGSFIQAIKISHLPSTTKYACPQLGDIAAGISIHFEAKVVTVSKDNTLHSVNIQEKQRACFLTRTAARA